jgi:hypothetical protein
MSDLGPYSDFCGDTGFSQLLDRSFNLIYFTLRFIISRHRCQLNLRYVPLNLVP